MNFIQKAVRKFLEKAAGFPIWRGNTTDVPPGGWASWDPNYGWNAAVSHATVYGCCRVLCQTIGSLPWSIYRKNGTGVDEATDHPLYPILHDSPNSYMTSMDFRQAIVMGYALRGNGYALKQSLNGRRIVGLLPLRADWMVPKWNYQTNEWIYEYHNFPAARVETYQPEQLIHIKNFCGDGLIGMSPLTVHAVRQAQITENYATSFLQNQARPSVILESDKPKPKGQNDYTERLSEDWNKLYSKENAGKTAVLWDGMKAHPITISPEDAQYIETRKLNASDITGIYGVPANMLGHTDKTATYASAEQFDLQFSKHCIRPLATLIEQTFNKALFATEPGVFCKFDLDDLQRGDSKAQADYYGQMVNHGIMIRNEARRKLNLPEISYANHLTIQANMVDLDKLPDLSASATPALVQGDIRKSAEIQAELDSIGALRKQLSEGLSELQHGIRRIKSIQ